MLYVLTRKSVFTYDAEDEDGHVETRVDVIGIYDDFQKVRTAMNNCVARTKKVMGESSILYETLTGLSYSFVQGTVDQEFDVGLIESMNIEDPIA